MNSQERAAFMRAAFGDSSSEAVRAIGVFAEAWTRLVGSLPEGSLPECDDTQPRPKNAPQRVVYYPPCGEFPESRCRNEYYPCLPGKCPMGGRNV